MGFLKGQDWIHKREQMVFQSKRKLKHFCELLSEKEGTKISRIWTQKWRKVFFFFFFLKGQDRIHQKEQMIFQSEWKLKHFCEILSEREGTKISWTEPKSDGRFFFLFWNFFFFKRSLMDSSKRKSGPPPIQMQTQTFLQAFIRKGKDQSFSNLNSKVRNLVFFFFLLKDI